MKFPSAIQELLDQNQDTLRLFDYEMDEFSSLKLRAFRDALYFFDKYPTMYHLTFSMDHHSTNKALIPSVVGVAWDDIATINRQKTDNSCVGVYISNSMNGKRSENIIPCSHGYTNWMAIYKEIKSHFSYLNKDPQFLRVLYKEQCTSPSICFCKYSDYGHFNISLVKEFQELMGEENMCYLRAKHLESQLANFSLKKNPPQKI